MTGKTIITPPVQQWPQWPWWPWCPPHPALNICHQTSWHVNHWNIGRSYMLCHTRDNSTNKNLTFSNKQKSFSENFWPFHFPELCNIKSLKLNIPSCKVDLIYFFSWGSKQQFKYNNKKLSFVMKKYKCQNEPYLSTHYIFTAGL